MRILRSTVVYSAITMGLAGTSNAMLNHTFSGATNGTTKSVLSKDFQFNTTFLSKKNPEGASDHDKNRQRLRQAIYEMAEVVIYNSKFNIDASQIEAFRIQLSEEIEENIMMALAQAKTPNVIVSQYENALMFGQDSVLELKKVLQRSLKRRLKELRQTSISQVSQAVQKVSSTISSLPTFELIDFNFLRKEAEELAEKIGIYKYALPDLTREYLNSISLDIEDNLDIELAYGNISKYGFDRNLNFKPYDYIFRSTTDTIREAALKPERQGYYMTVAPLNKNVQTYFLRDISGSASRVDKLFNAIEENYLNASYAAQKEVDFKVSETIYHLPFNDRIINNLSSVMETKKDYFKHLNFLRKRGGFKNDYGTDLNNVFGDLYDMIATSTRNYVFENKTINIVLVTDDEEKLNIEKLKYLRSMIPDYLRINMTVISVMEYPNPHFLKVANTEEESEKILLPKDSLTYYHLDKETMKKTLGGY